MENIKDAKKRKWIKIMLFIVCTVLGIALAVFVLYFETYTGKQKIFYSLVIISLIINVIVNVMNLSNISKEIKD